MNEVIKKTLKENSHPQLKCFMNAWNPLVQKRTISWRFPFYPHSSLLATFSCCFLVPLLQNLTLFLLFPFCPSSSLLASLLLMFLCNYFFFNFYFLFLLLNHTKSPSSQTPKKPFNILQQVSSNFKTKNTKTSFFYIKQSHIPANKNLNIHKLINKTRKPNWKISKHMHTRTEA